MTNRLWLDGVRVLVVDDARCVLDVVTDMLQCHGGVSAVDSAEEGFLRRARLARKEQPSGWLVDRN
jgi:CheY-like chemotaxis protein